MVLKILETLEVSSCYLDDNLNECINASWPNIKVIEIPVYGPYSSMHKTTEIACFENSIHEICC